MSMGDLQESQRHGEGVFWQPKVFERSSGLPMERRGRAGPWPASMAERMLNSRTHPHVEFHDRRQEDEEAQKLVVPASALRFRPGRIHDLNRKACS
jgi:hypothetical protein